MSETKLIDHMEAQRFELNLALGLDKHAIQRARLEAVASLRLALSERERRVGEARLEIRFKVPDGARFTFDVRPPGSPRGVMVGSGRVDGTGVEWSLSAQDILNAAALSTPAAREETRQGEKL